VNDAASLRDALVESRERTRRVADDLGGDMQFGPYLAIVNPPRWELGHVGWFQEFWCLRRVEQGRYSLPRSPSILPGADEVYNSALVPHASRWSLPLPEFEATLLYRDDVLERVLQRLSGSPSQDDRYFAGLAARHEDMHGEAFHYTRQTLGYPAPALAAHGHPAGGRVTGDAEIPGGLFPLGSVDDGRWAFDNEKWAHPVRVVPFRMGRAAVTCGEFARFVEDGGYAREALWTLAGWREQVRSDRRVPLYWRKAGAGWELRRFDRWVALPEDEPVMHVSCHEAEAYCRYAGRRLPTEAEWEFAATWDPATGRKRQYPWGDALWDASRANLENASPASVHAYPAGDNPWGVRQLVGNTWEWTATPFLPYPGFLRDPYKEYSEPWFATHRVLRGGAYTTSRRIGYATYRNFFTPGRADVFAGFRTCASGE